MHETVIARKIISDAEKKAKGRKIKSIALEVGELAHLPAEELEEILSVMTKWKIIISNMRAEAKCECGFRGHPKIIERGHEFCVYVCQKCGKVPSLSKGDKIIIKEIEV